MQLPAEVRGLASFAELLSWAMGVFAEHDGPNGLEAVRRANVRGANAPYRFNGTYGTAPNHVHAQYFLRMGWAEANQERFAERPPSPSDVKEANNPEAWKKGKDANEYFVGDGLSNFDLFCRGARIPVDVEQWLRARNNDFKSTARSEIVFRADAVLQAIEKTREVLVTPSPANSVSTLGRIAIHTPASRPTHDGPDRPPFEPYVVQPYTLLGSQLVGRGEELDALTDWFREGTSPILQVEALGGVGKTALLWEWFNSRPTEPHNGQMWWSFYEGDIRLDDLVTHAVSYFARLPLAEVRGMPALDREAELLGLLEGGRHLLVLDGLERATRAYATDDDAFVSDIEVSQAPKELWDLGGAALTDQSLSRSEQLRRLADDALGSFLKDLAALSGAKTLISTRNPVFDLEWRSGLPIEGVETLRIRGLSSDAAATLWKEITGTTASAPVLETLASVDNHPLFVRLLGAEVAQYRPAPGNFAAWQEGHPDFDPIGVLANDTRKRHILRFAMSGLDELQRAVLTGIAHASRPVAFAEIDSAILPALSGPRGPSRSGRLSDVLRSLEDRALIGWDRAGNKYDAHPIVRGVVRSLTGFQAATSQRADATIYRGTDVGLPERAPAPEAPAYVDGLPTSCRLVDVLGLTEITPQAITQGWRSGTGSPSAVIGVTESGVLELDLRGPAHGPNAHGPHGLIGGTTGSGKSELLQTIITSLALVNSPDYMNFLLVDYKGGAAFKTCSELPHTVGLVTELDSHLAERLVSSLYGELRRREEILRRNNARDIDEYLAQRGFGQPLPRLVVVIDEFASLVRDVPEFIHGTLDIARLGRSLGIHLLLGTQRPSGVISPQLSANTELRIALRTADATDSADVIGVPDAADLPRSAPGRALLRGVGGPLFAFQTARVGGHGPGVDPFSNEPTDLDLLASAITEAAAGIRPPRQPWLPPLPETVTLDQVAAAFPDSVPHYDDGAVPIGLADLPQQQRREAFRFNVRRCGHLEVISGARAGRSNVLIVLAAAIGRWLSPATAHLYIADLDTGRLRHLRSLPHVGGFVGPYDPQGLKDLSRTLIQIIEERRDRATSAGVDEDRLMPWIRDQDLPSVIVLVDGIERIMNDTSETGQTDVAEAWTRILRTGANVGVSVVLTGEPDVLRSRLSAGMNDKLLLRMPDTLTFLQLGLRRTNIPRHMPEGRAFNDMGCEIQIAVLAEDPSTDSQAGALSRLTTAARARWADVPPEKLPRPIS